ncbi:MAG: acetate kinase [Tissierellia bacterium]|nr:acetate kinase [Tissierellia bacterium]
MNVLVINCGSSSLKFQVINPQNEEVKAKGLVERIGIPNSRVKYEPAGGEKIEINTDIPNHKVGIKLVIDALTDPNHGIVKSMDDITAVGHRVVHGAEDFNQSVIINDEVMDALERSSELAPLHNPANIQGIEACKELMPNTPMVGVFDTAFHQTLEPVNFIYSLPYEYYENNRIRRYGFHGTSHKFVSERAAELLGQDTANVIVCHLGNGSSISAVKDGKCIDTSMGFTPLEGLTMGTRCGDIDPAIIPFIGKKENLTYDEMDNLMNKKSGVLGISGISSDFRDLEDAASQGNYRAQLALDIFASKVIKYIGQYMTEFDYIDGIAFTAGVGENSADMRKQIIDGLKIFGIKIDEEKNNIRGIEAIVSTDDSTAKVFVIPTNEELMIARDTYQLTK